MTGCFGAAFLTGVFFDDLLIFFTGCLGNEHLIEFFEEGGQGISEELVGFAQAAALGEGGVVEVVGVDACHGGDVVADVVEPGELVGREGDFFRGFVHEPVVEAVLDGFGEGAEFRLFFEGVADERDQVGEAVGGTAAFDAFGGGGVAGVPEGFFVPRYVFVAEFGFEFLERGFGEALFVGAGVEDLEGCDFGAVGFEVGAEVFEEVLGFFPGGGVEAAGDDVVGVGGIDGLFVFAFGAEEGFAEVGVVEGGAGGGGEFFFGGG